MSRPPASHNFHPDAETEAYLVADYYDEVRESLGDRFEVAFNRALDRSLEIPKVAINVGRELDACVCLNHFLTI
ncbi:MAG: hypothetical protein P1V97_00375 [Planctomycetota bacterium]|nr:hypothetical protein [Planctomycetota bacterium]